MRKFQEKNLKKTNLFLKVKWENYSIEDSTWEPLKNFFQKKELIEKIKIFDNSFFNSPHLKANKKIFLSQKKHKIKYDKKKKHLNICGSV